MKIYKTVEPDENDTPIERTWTEQDVLDYYWHYWLGKMEQANKLGGRSVEELTKMCIDDWIVVNWAWRVK